MTHSFGLIPSPPGLAPWGVLGGVSTDGPDTDLHLSVHARRGGDQNPTQTCVWWAMAQSLWVSLGYEGLPQHWLSVLAGYYQTRLRTHGGDKDKVVDLGCRPPDAAMVISELGWVPSSRWPFLPSRVDEEPPYDVHVSVLPGWFKLRRIITADGGRGKAIRSVIHHLHRPVLIGQQVNQDYLDWRPGDPAWTLPFGEAIGRHMECIIGYDSVGPRTISSWGDTFDRIIAWKQVESDSVSDLWYPEIDFSNVQL